MVVVQNNHRDYSDPALIRPGRVTYEIELAKMRAPEISQMLNYYYINHNCHNEDLNLQCKKDMIKRIAQKWDGKYKPSKIETICQRNSLASLHGKVMQSEK